MQLANGSQNRLAGFYTINEERLLGLSGAVLERFNRAGYLQAIYMAIASLSQFPRADRAHEQAQCWRALTKSARSPASIRARCRTTSWRRREPLVLKGVVADWPIVRAGLESAQAADAYMRKFYRDATVGALLGAPGYRRTLLL